MKTARAGVGWQLRGETPNQPRRAGTYRIGIACFILAFVFRFGIVLATGRIHQAERPEMETAAFNWAFEGQVGNPYSFVHHIRTGPSAHVAPGYALVLAGIYWLFGAGTTGETVQQAVACALSSVRAGMVPLFGGLIGLPPAASAVAGLLGAFYIRAINTELKGAWEGPMAAMALMVLVLWRLEHGAAGAGGYWFFVGYGLAWGTALLTAPALAPVAAGELALALWPARRRQVRFHACGALLFSIACAAVLTPWTIRNYVTLGGPVWGRDNLGLELAVSFGDDANWSNPYNTMRLYEIHPSRNAVAALQLRKEGELAFNRRLEVESLACMRTHPREALSLIALRFFHFWFPPGASSVHGALLALLTLVAFAGPFWLREINLAVFATVAMIWLTYPMVFYLMQWSSRYRVPIDWTLVFCSGVAVAYLAGLVTGHGTFIGHRQRNLAFNRLRSAPG